MIHYHGTPCGATREDVARFAKGRHMLVPFLRPEDIGTIAEVSQSFVIDSSAYTAWKQSIVIDFNDYHSFVRQWWMHPAFDFAIVDDVIDGTEADNDALIDAWPKDLEAVGAPVWHMHESLPRLRRLCQSFRRVCLGSSGEFATVGTDKWWRRMSEAMPYACEHTAKRLNADGDNCGTDRSAPVRSSVGCTTERRCVRVVLGPVNVRFNVGGE